MNKNKAHTSRWHTVLDLLRVLSKRRKELSERSGKRQRHETGCSKIHSHMYACTKCNLFTRSVARSHVHNCTYTRARAYTYTHTHTRTHARTHARTHTNVEKHTKNVLGIIRRVVGRVDGSTHVPRGSQCQHGARHTWTLQWQAQHKRKW